MYSFFIKNDSTIGWGSKNIVRMPGLQCFYLVRDRLVRTDEDCLNKRRMFAGQKMFVQIIAGKFATIVTVYELFICLTA
jgi:hypothetical protein